MNARVYDSDIGRFLSADSIIQDPLDSQAFNRYSYVRNNPMMYTDPSGHSWWSKFKKKIKRAWKKVVGVVLIVVGVVVALVPGYQTIGASIAGAGVSLYNYDKTGKFEFQAPIIETGGGGSGKNPAEQQDQIDAIQDEEIARAETLSGTQNNLGASSDNGKYANGAGSGSGDMVYDSGTKTFTYTPSTQFMQDRRQNQLDSMVALSLNAEYVDPKTKSLISDYRDNYYIMYYDDPYLNRDGSFRSDDPLDATYRGGMRGPRSSYGRGVMITSLGYETNVNGGGYMNDNYIDTFFHEFDHDKRLLGPRSGGRHEDSYYKYVRNQRNDFLRSMHEDRYAQGMF